MTTKEKILRHLQAGHSLTPLEAVQAYGTMSLPYHIFALRREGYNIRTRIRRNFQGTRYAEYYLVDGRVEATANA